MPANDFVFLSRAEYFRDLAQTVARTKAGSRALVSTMSFEPSEPLVGALMGELCAAARRGVHVTVMIDAYSFLTSEHSNRPGPLWSHNDLPKNIREPFHSQRGALEALTEAGGRYVITNKPQRPFSVIPAGRSHIKTAIVDNVVYIGGCNLREPEQLDVMVKWRSPKAADWVYESMFEVLSAQSVREAFHGVDRGIQLNASTNLFIDAGTPHQSLILDEAYQLIDSAKEWIFLTCQYFPGDTTAKHLKAAHNRGVRVEIAYSHPSAHGHLQAPAHHAYALKERLRLPASFFSRRLPKGSPLLHAKVLCTDQGVMLGSHNYVVQGVNFGTAEIALLNRSPAFTQRLIHKLTSTLPARAIDFI